MMFDSWSFKYAVEGWFMPAVSLFGIAGNALSIYILHHREVKLKTDFVEVLCSLATFDNLLLVSTFFLFTVPTLSTNYFTEYFPYTVPYLYPMTNTFMTCSVYMTAAVAVNRYLDTSQAQVGWRIKSGYVQAFIVAFVSVVVNVPRWFEFEYDTVTGTANVTVDGEVMQVNKTKVIISATGLRQRNDYIRDYTLISSTVLIVLVPTVVMLIRKVFEAAASRPRQPRFHVGKA